jgi:hypothetical protein
MNPIDLLMQDGWEIIGNEYITKDSDSASYDVYFLEREGVEIKVTVYD